MTEKYTKKDLAKLSKKKIDSLIQLREEFDNLKTSSLPYVEAEIVSNFGYGLVARTYEPSTSEIVHFPCIARRMLKGITVGDKVLAVQPNESMSGIVEHLHRRPINCLYRQKSKHETKIITANIDILLIMVSMNQRWNNAELDSYIITARAFNIEPIIVCNKVDLATSSASLPSFSYYKDKQVRVIYISTYTNVGIDELLEKISGQNTALIGVSGVGKSSLINCIIPDANAQVQSISEASGLGKHTTTYTTRYLYKNGTITDIPGIRKFSMPFKRIDEQLEQTKIFFHEIYETIKKCRFYDCKHLNEPDCAVNKAIEETNWFDIERLNSYLSITEYLDTSKKDK